MKYYKSKFAIVLIIVSIISLYACTENKNESPTYVTPAINKHSSVI